MKVVSARQIELFFRTGREGEGLKDIGAPLVDCAGSVWRGSHYRRDLRILTAALADVIPEDDFRESL